MEVTPEFKALAERIAKAHPLERRKFAAASLKSLRHVRLLGAAPRFAENDETFTPPFKPEAA